MANLNFKNGQFKESLRNIEEAIELYEKGDSKSLELLVQVSLLACKVCESLDVIHIV